MRTLHVGLRVQDLERSRAFYTRLGYEVIGTVAETPMGSLTMLKLPEDDFWTSWLTDPDGYRIELVQWPAGHADGLTRADFPEEPPRLPSQFDESKS